jgi:hypothetical protein
MLVAHVEIMNVLKYLPHYRIILESHLFSLRGRHQADEKNL